MHFTNFKNFVVLYNIVCRHQEEALWQYFKKACGKKACRKKANSKKAKVIQYSKFVIYILAWNETDYIHI